MRIREKTYKALHYITPLMLGAVAIWITTSLPMKKLSPLPTKEIGGYTITLNKNVPAYNHLLIQDRNKNTKLYAFDHNKDTIIDEIHLNTYSPDSTLKKLASVKELSKIEKELLKR
jgi:hypothetical protein